MTGKTISDMTFLDFKKKALKTFGQGFSTMVIPVVHFLSDPPPCLTIDTKLAQKTEFFVKDCNLLLRYYDEFIKYT